MESSLPVEIHLPVTILSASGIQKICGDLRAGLRVVVHRYCYVLAGHAIKNHTHAIRGKAIAAVAVHQSFQYWLGTHQTPHTRLHASIIIHSVYLAYQHKSAALLDDTSSYCSTIYENQSGNTRNKLDKKATGPHLSASAHSFNKVQITRSISTKMNTLANPSRMSRSNRAYTDAGVKELAKQKLAKQSSAVLLRVQARTACSNKNPNSPSRHQTIPANLPPELPPCIALKTIPAKRERLVAHSLLPRLRGSRVSVRVKGLCVSVVRKCCVRDDILSVGRSKDERRRGRARG
eukprot:1393338-Pleurochrysis_carterae.AAC.2